MRIERTGDFWQGKIKPRIRIGGQWLEQAGFKCGHCVLATVEEPGMMTLRFIDQSSYAGHDSGL
ncbi:MAG: hypothetical protein ACLQU3_19905 [Limisphaerales bacterium]